MTVKARSEKNDTERRVFVRIDRSGMHVDPVELLNSDKVRDHMKAFLGQSKHTNILQRLKKKRVPTVATGS